MVKKYILRPTNTEKVKDVARFSYLANRYQAILNIIRKHSDWVSEEEKIDYLFRLVEAQMSYNILQDKIWEEEKFPDKDNFFCIQFDANQEGFSVVLKENSSLNLPDQERKENKQYQNYINWLFSNNNEEISSKTMTFQVTDNCNLRCSYCYQGNKHTNVMSFDLAKEMIDQMFENRKKEDYFFYEGKTTSLVIDFIGGEPLLYPDLVYNIIEYFEYKCLQNPDSPWLLKHMFSISTNGTTYFSPKVQKMLEDFAPIISLGITLDGVKEYHDACRVFADGSGGSYDICEKAAVYHLQKYGGYSTKITISPDNVQYVCKAIKNMYNLGFKEIHINCVFENVWTKEKAIELYYQMKDVVRWIKENDLWNQLYIRPFDKNTYCPWDKDQNWCGATSNMLAMDYRGDFYPCIRFMESSLGTNVEPYKIGSLKEGIGTTEIYKKRLLDLESLKMTNQSTEECIKCPIGRGCSWCTGYNYQTFGTIFHRATFICDCHKALSLANYYYENCKGISHKAEISKQLALSLISEQEWEEIQEGG